MVDAVGKLSLLDAFALMVIAILGTFQVHFAGGVGAAMFIELELGFQAFLGGTIICMLVGHLIVLLHHRAAKPMHLQKANKASLTDKLPLTIQQDSSLPSDNTSQNLKRGACIYASALVAVGLGLLIGSFMTFTVLEVEGLFGWFLNYLHETNLKVRSNPGNEQLDLGKGNVFTLSVMSLGYSLGADTPAHTALWAAQLQAIYFAFTVVFVMLFIVVGIVQCWWILMRQEFNAHKEQLVLLKFIGSTLFAWAAIDVFVIGADVTVYELASGSFTYTSPFFTSLIHDLRTNLDIPGDGDVIMTLRPKLCAGAYLTSGSALAFIGVGVQFIRFLGRLQVLPQQQAAFLAESDGTQQEAVSLQQETAPLIKSDLPQQEAAPLMESNGAKQEVTSLQQETAPLIKSDSAQQEAVPSFETDIAVAADSA